MRAFLIDMAKKKNLDRGEPWRNKTDLNLPGEEWKIIEKYNGKYAVSGLGRVKNLNYRNTGKEHIVPQQITNHGGYLKVILEEGGRKDSPLVHDLVAQEFLPNPYGCPCVNHMDGDPTNNVVENLEWCTCGYNSNYGDVKEKLSKAQSRPVLQFTKTGEFVAEYKSIKEAASVFHCSSGTIVAALKGATASAKGFCWKYKSNTPTGGA